MKVRMDVVHIQSQLVVQIENFAFLNEIQWLEWAHQSNAQFVLQNELLVLMTKLFVIVITTEYAI